MGQCGDAAAAMESARPGGDGSAAAARAALRAAADPARSRALRRFFKTGKGEYAEGDRFLGLTVPQLRALAQRFRGLPLPGLASMLGSPYHEERLLALLILVDRFHRAGSEAERESLLRFYLGHLREVDNWDLVDLSAEHILGPYAATSAAGVVERLSRSPRVWDRRVAVLAHFHDIRRGRGDAFLRFAPRFFEDDHDLIHKAVGWMLREVGKRSGVRALERFLDRHARAMPRTMLRYAIERLPEPRRRAYLDGVAVRSAARGKSRH